MEPTVAIEPSPNAPANDIVAMAEATLTQHLTIAGVTIDASLILTIIQKIISVLSGCKASSASVASSLQSPGAFTRLVVHNQVANALREHYGLGAWFRHDGAKVEAGVLSASKQSTAADIEALAAVDLGSN